MRTFINKEDSKKPNDFLWQVEEICRSTSWSKKAFYEELQNNDVVCYSIHADNKFAGFIILRKLDLELHIMSISVLPEFQNHGLGFKLIEYSINDLFKTLKIGVYILEVSENNIAAVRLYQKYGFKKIGLRKNYYPNGDNAIVMKYVYSV